MPGKCEHGMTTKERLVCASPKYGVLPGAKTPTLVERLRMAANCTTDCRTEVGVTVGLIDSLIAIARVLAKRDLSPAEAREALADLRADEDMARVLGPNTF